MEAEKRTIRPACNINRDDGSFTTTEDEANEHLIRISDESCWRQKRQYQTVYQTKNLKGDWAQSRGGFPRVLDKPYFSNYMEESVSSLDCIVGLRWIRYWTRLWIWDFSITWKRPGISVKITYKQAMDKVDALMKYRERLDHNRRSQMHQLTVALDLSFNRAWKLYLAIQLASADLGTSLRRMCENFLEERKVKWGISGGWYSLNAQVSGPLCGLHF